VGSNEHEKAIEDLEKAKELSLEQEEFFDNEIIHVKALEKQYSQNQKKKYSGFFNKLSKDSEDKQDAPDDQTY
jgi:hypothetical protein